MIICWWSAGVTSAVATKLAIQDNKYRQRIILDKKKYNRNKERWKK
jgi:hypothetical protein